MMLKLYLKEKALYLLDNPTRLGFSWWFFFAGIAAAYGMFRRYGDSYYVVMVVEKYAFVVLTLLFGLVRRLVERSVKAGDTSRDSAMLYLIPLAGYVGTFLFTILVFHFIFGLFIQ